MSNTLEDDVDRRRTMCAALRPLWEENDQLTDDKLRTHPFDFTVLLSLCYAADTWAKTAPTSKLVCTIHRALKRCSLKDNQCTRHQAGLHSSDLRIISRIHGRANVYQMLSTNVADIQ